MATVIGSPTRDGSFGRQAAAEQLTDSDRGEPLRGRRGELVRAASHAVKAERAGRVVSHVHADVDGSRSNRSISRSVALRGRATVTSSKEHEQDEAIAPAQIDHGPTVYWDGFVEARAPGRGGTGLYVASECTN